MKLTNLGGATAILEHSGKRILFDPWLDDGIFHGAWYHYPPLKVGIADLGRFDYVYISHIHEDHCSAGTIRHLNPDAEILIMDRQPNFVARFLENHGFQFKRVHLIPPRTPTRIAPDLVVDMVEADPANEIAHIIDSALILKWDDRVIYNANDCQPYPDGLRYIKDTYGKVDLALVPYSGGSSYPACYSNLTYDEKLLEKRRIIDQRLDAFVRTVEFLQPTTVLPFADQYVVAGSRSYLNELVAHPPCSGAVLGPVQSAKLEDRLILLNSGQSFDLDTQRLDPEEPYRCYSEQDRAHYVREELGGARYDHERIAFDPSVSIERLLQGARERLWQVQQRKGYAPRFSFYLEATDRQMRFHLPLDAPTARSVGWQEPLVEPYLRISATSTLLAMLLIGHVSWNIADAALFLDYERVPNRYDPETYVFLNFLRI